MIYDVYGFSEPNLGDQPNLLANALNVVWEEHDSDYRGVHFTVRGQAPGDGKLLLQSNDLHGSAGRYHQLPDFPEY